MVSENLDKKYVDVNMMIIIRSDKIINIQKIITLLSFRVLVHRHVKKQIKV